MTHNVSRLNPAQSKGVNGFGVICINIEKSSGMAYQKKVRPVIAIHDGKHDARKVLAGSSHPTPHLRTARRHPGFADRADHLQSVQVARSGPRYVVPNHAPNQGTSC